MRGVEGEDAMKRTPLKRKKAWGRLGCGAMAFLAKPVTEGDKHFDSTTERDRYRFLEMLEKGGAISDLRFREKVIIIVATSRPGVREPRSRASSPTMTSATSPGSANGQGSCRSAAVSSLAAG